jgi:hypothetical protein
VKCYNTSAMADNDQLLKQLNKRFDDIEKNMATKQDIQRVEQTQAQHGTILEAVAAGQEELQKTVATKADILTVEVKVDKLRKRIEGIEEHTGSSTHKN